MPPRKSNVSQTNAPGEDGTPVKEREGINIEVGHNFPLGLHITFWVSVASHFRKVSCGALPALTLYLFSGSFPPATLKAHG